MELEFRLQTRTFAVVIKQQQNKTTEIMKITKNLKLATVAATLLFQTSAIRADDNRDAIITWTKHVTAFLPPGGDVFGTIAGTAGGDLGTGTVIGDAFNPIEVVPGGLTFEAEYHFVGSKHSLTVHFRTVQSLADNSGVIIGVVADGWLKDNVVEGRYTARACDEGVNLTCFDGVFVIKKGSKAKD